MSHAWVVMAQIKISDSISINYQLQAVRHHFRRKYNKKVDPKKTTCMLYLQADHLFHEQMGTEEATIDVMTRHVQRVNSIYKDVGE